MNDDIQVLLEDAGARWRSGQPDPNEPNWPRITTRSKTPLWVAAAVVVIAGVVAAVLTVPGGSSTPAHLKSAPIAHSRLPYPKGATVPPPFEIPISHPGPMYCPSNHLTGSFVAHGQRARVIAEIRIRLRPHISQPCDLPTMLGGRNALQLVDRTGHVQSRGKNVADYDSINPPSFAGTVTLRPGKTATMYLIPEGTAYCSSPVIRAVINYNDLQDAAPLSIPVSGLGSCGDQNTTQTFIYGPLSTPENPVAFENQSWSHFHATLQFPTDIPTSGSVTFRATLRNSGKLALPLEPCPRYGLELTDQRGSRESRLGSIGCPKNPRIVQPGRSITLTLTTSVRGLAPGRYTVEWAIAGMKSARAETTAH